MVAQALSLDKFYQIQRDDTVMWTDLTREEVEAKLEGGNGDDVLEWVIIEIGKKFKPAFRLEEVAK